MDKIIPSFKDSLFNSSSDMITDMVEVGIDSLLNEGVLKDIPIVGLLLGVKNIAQNLHDRNLLRQTLQFIKEFNSGTIDEEKLKEYRESIDSDSKKAEEELGRVLIILNNNIELEKSKMLANLFRNYINGNIDWNQFCEFSEIVKMLFINDVQYLKEMYTGRMKDTVGIPLYRIERLNSLGLVNTAMKTMIIGGSGSSSRTDKYVDLSGIGGKFYLSIIQS